MKCEIMFVMEHNIVKIDSYLNPMKGQTEF